MKLRKSTEGNSSRRGGAAHPIAEVSSRLHPNRVLESVAWLVALCMFQWGLSHCQAVEVFVQLSGRAYPETLTINRGDTVTFVWGWPSLGSTESYTGEWSSPMLASGQTFSHTFTNTGSFVYRAGSLATGFEPGMIMVQPQVGAPVWIASPFDSFVAPGYTDIEALTTNSPQAVAAVNFYADGQLVGSVSNTPYVVTVDFSTNLGTYAFTASVVDTGGRTNTSTPIRITFSPQNPLLFEPFRLPQGQIVMFESEAGGPFCLYWSDDLKTWNGLVNGQWVGRSIVVDETTTNVMQRFYYMKECL